VESYTIEAARVTTLYTRCGDWLGALCVIVTLALLVAARLIPAGVVRDRQRAVPGIVSEDVP
jgi:apolipoprotein N-acyltransferase